MAWPLSLLLPLGCCSPTILKNQKFQPFSLSSNPPNWKRIEDANNVAEAVAPSAHQSCQGMLWQSGQPKMLKGYISNSLILIVSRLGDFREKGCWVEADPAVLSASD